MEKFCLDDGEYIELHRLLKTTGSCPSGGLAKLLIAEGWVSVDGKVELRKRCKIRRGQVVEFKGKAIAVT